jgi:hypothetical protein
MRKYCTPALFVTINPHDLTGVVPSIVDIDIDEWSTMSSFERAKVIASRPDAAALAFDMQIRAFINVVLKYKKGPGVFGHCQAYYAMVEAQGRGTLHCHMLLWIAGNPSPQVLRDRLAEEDGFQEKMFAWLESIISCELPTDIGCVVETGPQDAKKPVRASDDTDPRLEAPPQIAELDSESFALEFRDFLTRLAIECNWHTCTMTRAISISDRGKSEVMTIVGCVWMVHYRPRQLLISSQVQLNYADGGEGLIITRT